MGTSARVRRGVTDNSMMNQNVAAGSKLNQTLAGVTLPSRSWIKMWRLAIVPTVVQQVCCHN